MTKFIKRFLVGLLVFIVVIVASAIILPIVYKTKIVEYVQKEANRNLNATLSFNTDIRLNLWTDFPNFHVGIDDLRIINKAPFVGDTLAKVASLDATFDIMSVLTSDKIQVRRLDLERPSLNLHILKDGTANYDIALKSKEEKKPTEEPAKFKLGLKEYSLKNATIVYNDESLGFLMRMDSMNHNGEGDFTQDVFDLVTKTTAKKLNMCYGGVKYLSNVNTDMDATLSIDMLKSIYTFKENKLKLNELSVKFDGTIAMPSDPITMDLKFAANETDFKTLLSFVPALYSKDFAGLKADGKMAVNGVVKGDYTSKEYPAFNVNMKVENGMFKYPDLPASVDHVNMNATVACPQGSLDNMTLATNASFIMANDPFTANVKVATPLSDLFIDAALKGKIDLGNLSKVVKLEKGTELSGILNTDLVVAGKLSAIEKQQFEKFDAHGSIEAKELHVVNPMLPTAADIHSMLLAFSPKHVMLSDFNMNLGKSDIKLDGTLDNMLGYVLKGGDLKGTLNLKSSLFDINALYPPTAASTSAAAQPATGNPQPSTMSAIEIPGRINFTLTALMERVLYEKMDLSKLKGVISIADKVLHFNQVGMNILNGSLNADGYYDSKDMNKPVADLKLKVNKVSIPGLFEVLPSMQKFAGIAKYCTGDMSAALNVNTAIGKDMMPVWTSFTSKGILDIPKLIVDNFNPFHELGSKLKLEKFDHIVLTGIKPSYIVKDGRVSLTDPVSFMVDDINLSIIGSSGLDKTLDYVADIKIPASHLRKQINTTINDLLRKKAVNLEGKDFVNITALIKGTFEHPTIELDLKDAIKGAVEVAKEKIKEEVKVYVDDAKKKATDEAQKQADKILAEAEKQAQAIKDAAKIASDKARKEGYAQADALVAKAGNNPVAKFGAEKAATQLRKETDKKADQIISEANTRADGVMNEARNKAALIKK